MKKILVPAALLLAPLAAQAAVLSTVRVSGVPKLPSFPVPIITIKPEIQLPSPLKKALTPTLQLQSRIVIAVPNNAQIGEKVTVKILPAVPLQFPGRKPGKDGIKELGALFDGSTKDEPKPVVAPQTTQPEKLPVPVKIEEIITKGRNYTLPERTLEDEIGI